MSKYKITDIETLVVDIEASAERALFVLSDSSQELDSYCTDAASAKLIARRALISENIAFDYVVKIQDAAKKLLSFVDAQYRDNEN